MSTAFNLTLNSLLSPPPNDDDVIEAHCYSVDRGRQLLSTALAEQGNWWTMLTVRHSTTKVFVRYKLHTTHNGSLMESE